MSLFLAHTGSSYAAKQARRREREKKTGYQKTPFHSAFLASPSSSVDNFHARGALEQDSVPTSGRGHEWALGERNGGQQTHTGNGYVRSGGPTETPERLKMQRPTPGAELFLDSEPSISHTSVNRDEFSHTAFVKEAPNRRRGSDDRGKGDEHEQQDRYNFLSHGSQQLSQPQPPSQPQSQHSHCQPHNASDHFSMDVQYPSLASNSLPHAVMVIQGYTPPKDTSAKEPSVTEVSDPVITRQRKTLESLRDIERGITDSLRNLDNRIQEENSRKEQIEQEYIGREMAGIVGPSEDSGPHRSRHHSLRELEERRKETHKQLKQLEVDRHNAKTRLQEIQHEIKLRELSLDAEESERKIEGLRGSEYSVGDRISSRDQGRSGTSKDVTGMTGYDSLKRREYMAAQRVADGKEGQSLSTQCPPIQLADKSVQNRVTHSHPLGEGRAESVDVKHLIGAFSSGPHREVGHTRQRSGTSDSYHGGLRRGSDGSEGYRSLDRLRDKRDCLGRTKPDHQQHTREGSYGSTDNRLGSSRTRQPGVGGWDHSAPPPTLPKPFKSTVSSDTATLSPFTMDGHVEHCNLSPSESDLLEYPRPPPTGGNWQSPSQLLNLQLPPTSAKREQTKDVSGVLSTHSHEPSPNTKQWTDREAAERRVRVDKAVNGSVEDQQLRHEGSYQPPYPPARMQVQYGSTHYHSDSWRRKSTEMGLSHNHQMEPPKLQKQPQQLQFQNPPLGSEEAATSSQVTGYPEDIPTFDSYLYGHMASHGNEPIVVSQRSEGSTRSERSGIFPSAYASSQRLDVVGPWREQDAVTSPRVVPVTTRMPDSYYSDARPRPPQPPYKSPAPPSAASHRPAIGKRPNTNYGGKTDFLLKYPPGVTTVSRTDL